jgi:hypothetical protein
VLELRYTRDLDVLRKAVAELAQSKVAFIVASGPAIRAIRAAGIFRFCSQSAGIPSSWGWRPASHGRAESLLRLRPGGVPGPQDRARGNRPSRYWKPRRDAGLHVSSGEGPRFPPPARRLSRSIPFGAEDGADLHGRQVD